jgi:hypothetical protein
MSRYLLDPNAVEDFGFDWAAKTHGVSGATSDWLENGETLTAATVTADDGGLTITNVTFTPDGLVTYRVSQGTVNTEQRVTCHVVSSTGRADDKTDRFIIRDQ